MCSHLTICFSALLALAGVVAPQSNSLEKEVKNSEMEYRDAVLKNDLGYFINHIAPGYTGIDSDGSVMSATELIAARKANVYTVHKLDMLSQNVAVSGNTAVISECLRVDALKNGTQIQTNLQVSRVWQKIGERWMVLAFQATPRSLPCPI